jgi:ribosomal protein S14
VICARCGTDEPPFRPMLVKVTRGNHVITEKVNLCRPCLRLLSSAARPAPEQPSDMAEQRGGEG